MNITDISGSSSFLSGVLGANDNDSISGLDGNDSIYGYGGNDSLYGGEGNDHLSGGNGNNTLYGNDGKDYLSGGNGDDFLDGGAGTDQMFGSSGNDYYVIRDRSDRIYEDSGTDEALVLVDFYQTVDDVEKWTYAPGVLQLPYWVDALLPNRAPSIPGYLGESKTFYYCFPTDMDAAAEYLRSSLGSSYADRSGLQAFTMQQQAFARQALAYVSTIADIRFVETFEADAILDLNTIVFLNNLQASSAGYAYYPDDLASGSNIFLDVDTTGNLAPKDGERAALTMIHEIGHALGLKHPFSHPETDGDIADAPYLSVSEENSPWTVMSYNKSSDQYHLQFSPFDIATLQYLYGPSTAQKTNDVYQLQTESTNLIWDGYGTDTIDGSNIAEAMTLYLQQGRWGYIGSQASLISSAGQVSINIGSVIENAIGGSGNDAITGNSSDNQIAGAVGNDTLDGGAGNDLLDGGAGTDTAVMQGARSSYTVTATATGFTVADKSGSQGIDTLTNVERIQFDDIGLAYDIDGNAGMAYRLYKAAFDRAPDLPGLGFWISRLDAGHTMQEVALAFFNSDEFKTLYGAAPSNADLLTRYYQNVLDREPDQAGYAWWTDILDRGLATPAQVLFDFSESAENKAQLIGVIQGGIEYTPYV